MTEFASSESHRVKEIALSRFPNGRLIVATFKLGAAIKQVHYISPRDIPEEIRFWGPGWSVIFRLWSVQPDGDFNKKPDLKPRPQPKPENPFTRYGHHD